MSLAPTGPVELSEQVSGVPEDFPLLDFFPLPVPFPFPLVADFEALALVTSPPVCAARFAALAASQAPISPQYSSENPVQRTQGARREHTRQAGH